MNPEKSIEFLELLSQKNDLFISFDVKSSQSVVTNTFETKVKPEDLNNGTLEKRQLEQLSVNKKGFDSTGRQKEDLRRFHQLLTEHTNRDALVVALSEYYVWLRNRVFISTQEELDSTKDAKPDDRVELIYKLEKDYFEKTFEFNSNRSRMPSFQDYKKIKAFGRRKIDELKDQLIDHLTSASVGQNNNQDLILERLKNAPTEHHFFAIMMRERSNLPGTAFPTNPFDSEEIRKFIEELSEESRRQLVGLSDEFQVFVVRIWILRTIRVIENADLSAFEDKMLNGKQRNSLNKYPTYNQKREILIKAFLYSLENINEPDLPSSLPDDLSELKFEKEKKKRGKK